MAGPDDWLPLSGIQHFCCLGSSVCIDNFFQDLFQLFLSYMEIYFQLHFVFRNASVYKAQILRQDLVEQETSQCGLYRTGLCCTCLLYTSPSPRD